MDKKTAPASRSPTKRSLPKRLLGQRIAPPPHSSLHHAPAWPQFDVSILSRLFFNWCRPIYDIAQQRPIGDTDLWRLPDCYLATPLATRFDALYAKGLASSRPRVRSWAIYRAFLALLPRELWVYTTFFRALGDLLIVFVPLVLRVFIRYCGDAYAAARDELGAVDPPIGQGIGLVAGLFSMFAIACLCEFQWVDASLRVSVLVRTALISSVFRHATTLDHRERAKWSVGRLMSLITTDIQRIDGGIDMAPSLWAAPMQLVVISVLLLVNLGIAAWAGIAVLLLLVPLNGYIMVQFARRRRAIGESTDRRIEATQEIFASIHTIKLFAWEDAYLKKIEALRKEEIEALSRIILLKAAASTVAVAAPPLAAVASFLAYARLNGDIAAPAVAFSSFALFGALTPPLELVPQTLSAIADIAVGGRRVEELYAARKVDPLGALDQESGLAVRLHRASFTWEPGRDADSPQERATGSSRTPTALARSLRRRLTRRVPSITDEKDSPGALSPPRPFTLSDISVDIERGQVIAIVGPVASGKSSVICALLGLMTRTAGTFGLGGSIVFCSQVPWIQSVSVKDNILFGRPYDATRYRTVLDDCCLLPDLETLTAGDATIVGERGVTLSGGQKQRLSLARALYHDADILLLDDPFSAVDAVVGRRIFDRAIRDRAPGKTIVLVTHALHLLPSVDCIYTLENGRIAERGAYDELLATRGIFALLVEQFVTESADIAAPNAAKTGETNADESDKAHTLMQAEERQRGGVTRGVYAKWLAAARGYAVGPPFLVAYVSAQACAITAAYALLWWQRDALDLSQRGYMTLYATLGIGSVLLYFIALATAALACIIASRRLHDGAVRSLLRAPMAFFNVNPLGRIISRLTSDVRRSQVPVDRLDQSLYGYLTMALKQAGDILSSLIVVVILSPWMLLPILVLGLIYAYLARLYYPVSRDIRRLHALLRARLYSHLNETYTGISTIIAFGQQDRIVAEIDHLNNVEARAYLLQFPLRGWLATRANSLGSLLYLTLGIFCLVNRRTISPSQIGLTMAYFLTMIYTLSRFMQISSQIENDMTSSERLLHYAEELDREGSIASPSVLPTSEWPGLGELILDNVEMHYRPELPAVLKGLSIHIRAGEKVGIVGRTGAGKSSIIHALFRLSELSGGRITVDGLDVATIDLSSLRRSVAIIPQDPVLFEGTLRSNLDPFDEVSDDAVIWQALRRAWLVGTEDEKCDPERHTLSLESPIESGGNNLSVGERALISLARALIKDSRICVLDEATASVDYATDALIQETIAREFRDKTVLTVAHRLVSILGSDRVLVMVTNSALIVTVPVVIISQDDGRAAELDTPLQLFRARGIFWGMCQSSGIAEGDIEQAVESRT